MEKKSWKEFYDTGLLWWINQILHTFGWTIVVTIDEVSLDVVSVFPARIKYRGFDEKTNKTGYHKVSKYLKENANVLLEETER